MLLPIHFKREITKYLVLGAAVFFVGAAGGHVQTLSVDFFEWVGTGSVSAKWLALVACTVFAAVFSLLAYKRISGVVLRERDVRKVREATCLVFFVSRQEALTRGEGGKGWRILGKVIDHEAAPERETGEGCRLRLRRLNSLIDQIVQPPAKPFAWQQMLRGVHPHIKHVKRIVLIGSAGVDGTHLAASELCAPFLRAFLGENAKEIQVEAEAVNFEDFESLKALLHRLVDRVTREMSMSERGIVFDITGGQRVVAVAAAALTLERDCTFQYVQTSGEKRILHYDIEYASGSAEDA